MDHEAPQLHILRTLEQGEAKDAWRQACADALALPLEHVIEVRLRKPSMDARQGTIQVQLRLDAPALLEKTMILSSLPTDMHVDAINRFASRDKKEFFIGPRKGQIGRFFIRVNAPKQDPKRIVNFHLSTGSIQIPFFIKGQPIGIQ